MRRKPWSQEKIATAKILWEKFRTTDETHVYLYLAELLSYGHSHSVDPQLLLAVSGSDNRRKRYTSFQLPKRRGGHRVIDVPEPSLRWIQSCLHHALTYLFRPHKCAHGFVPRHGIRTHAENHSGRRWVFIVDIQDFFPKIHWGRIYGMLQAKPFEVSSDAARLIANLTTYEQRLPQGAPTSPTISNMICRKMDHLLLTWARSKGYYYSRYADDLAFSTDKQEFPQVDREHIEQIIRSEGFEINVNKRRLLPIGSRQIVTGLVVNGNRPNVKREEVKNLRALLRNVIRHGWESQVNRAVHFMEFEKYRDYRAKKLPLKQLREILEKQKKEKLLISPIVRSLRASDVLIFQKVVRGKLAFIEDIKGSNSKSFQRLKDLANQAFQGTTGTLVNALYTEQFYRAERTYSDFKRKLEAEDGIAGFRALLNSPPEHSVAEFSWILPALDVTDPVTIAKIRHEILLTKFSALRSPKYTAFFFGYFRSDGYFKPILHSPDSSTEPFDVLLSKCQTVFESWKKKLPNRLQDQMHIFLKNCESFAAKHPGQYPWNNPDSLRNLILPFKQSTRFDEGMTEATDINDLFELLKSNLVSKLGAKANMVNIQIKKMRTVFTNVPAVSDGFAQILESMVSNSCGREILVTTDAVDGNAEKLGKYTVCIADHAGIITKGASIRGFFGNKLRMALKHLRGYVDWSISASFSDGTSYIFDVMQNHRLEPAQHQRGIQHALTFYRHEP